MYAIRSYYVIGFVDIFSNKRDEALLPGLIKINPFYLCDVLGYLVDQILIIRRYELPAILIIDRITSYNVCYTKLLRAPGRIHLPDQIAA